MEAPALGRYAKMEAIMSKTQPPTAKLSDAQLVTLSCAAQRPDGSLLPWLEFHPLYEEGEGPGFRGTEY